jgi:hypothetical protein
VVSGLLGSVREMCCKLGMTPAPHTVEHSLGVWGKVEEAAKKLAEPRVCGIFNPVRAADLMRKMVEQ